MTLHRQMVWTLAAALAMGCGTVLGQATSAPAKGGYEYSEGDRPEPATADKTGDDGTAAPAGEKPEPQPPAKKPPDSMFSQWLFPVMIGALVLMFVLSSRGKKKQARKREEMLATLKKGSKVTTIGGIVGTVIEVREDEVTVKVDEQNNVRMRFSRWAIRGVGDEAKTEAPEDKK